MIHKIGSTMPFHSKRSMKKLIYLNMVGSLGTPQAFFNHSQWNEIPDFLDWSLIQEELLVSCLTQVSDGLLRQLLYPTEAVKWLGRICS